LAPLCLVHRGARGLYSTSTAFTARERAGRSKAGSRELRMTTKADSDSRRRVPAVSTRLRAGKELGAGSDVETVAVLDLGLPKLGHWQAFQEREKSPRAEGARRQWGCLCGTPGRSGARKARRNHREALQVGRCSGEDLSSDPTRGGGPPQLTRKRIRRRFISFELSLDVASSSKCHSSSRAPAHLNDWLRRGSISDHPPEPKSYR
jgi:hypothetical protein